MKKNLLYSCMLLIAGITVAQEYSIGDHELLLMPTAYTMPKGSTYFTDYELLLLNITTAISDRTHIGLFSVFPVTTEVLESFSIGGKTNYYRSERFASAIWTSYTPKAELLSLGNTVSIPIDTKSIHIGLAAVYASDNENSWEPVYMFGFKAPMSQRITFLAEYTNSGTAFEEDFVGIITVGLRFTSSKISWELGGIRPLEGSGDLFLFPLLKATLLF